MIFFNFDLDTWAKMSLNFKFDWILMSNVWAMFDLADVRHFAGKMQGGINFCSPGVDTWAKRSLSFNFDWNLMSNGWAMLDLADARNSARKMHWKVKFLGFGLEA